MFVGYICLLCFLLLFLFLLLFRVCVLVVWFGLVLVLWLFLFVCFKVFHFSGVHHEKERKSKSEDGLSDTEIQIKSGST